MVRYFENVSNKKKICNLKLNINYVVITIFAIWSINIFNATKSTDFNKMQYVNIPWSNCMCIKKCSMIIYFISSSHSKDKYYSTELIFVSKLYYAYFTHFE